MNPLFSKFQNGGFSQLNGWSLMQRFNEFASNFRGNPKDKVDELLASGQMSRQQFEQLSQMARQFQGMTGRH